LFTNNNLFICKKSNNFIFYCFNACIFFRNFIFFKNMKLENNCQTCNISISINFSNNIFRNFIYNIFIFRDMFMNKFRFNNINIINFIKSIKSSNWFFSNLFFLYIYFYLNIQNSNISFYFEVREEFYDQLRSDHFFLDQFLL